MSDGEYLSPDGQLRLFVAAPQGDLTVGFSGFSWHTHGSVLAALSGKTEAEAVRDFVTDVTSSKRVIAMIRQADKLLDVWISDSPEKDLKHRAAAEVIEFRLWYGTPIYVSESHESGPLYKS